MKILAALLFIFLATATCVTVGEAAQQMEWEQGQITAEGIPECLHIGDRVEATVSVDAGWKPSKNNLTVSLQWGRVSATPFLAGALDEPITVIIRGKKFGKDSITLSVPSRPDITPLTKNIIVLPSFEPPESLSTNPTEKFLHVAPPGEGGGKDFFRGIFLKWRPKEGVNFYWIQILDAERNDLGGGRAPADANSKMQYTAPGENRFWRIRASINTCTGDSDWTPFGQFMPFKS